MNESPFEYYVGDTVIVGDMQYFVSGWNPNLRRMSLANEIYSSSVIIGVNFEEREIPVELVTRGNIYRSLHGEELIPFSDYLEEARFWYVQDMLDEVRNPHDNFYYSWTMEQGVAALEAGVIDTLLVRLDIFERNEDGTGRLGGFKVLDEKAGRHLREVSLAALGAQRVS